MKKVNKKAVGAISLVGIALAVTMLALLLTGGGKNNQPIPTGIQKIVEKNVDPTDMKFLLKLVDQWQSSDQSQAHKKGKQP